MARKKTLVTSREGDSSSFSTHSDNLSDCKCYSLFLCHFLNADEPEFEDDEEDGAIKLYIFAFDIFVLTLFSMYFWLGFCRVLRFDFGFPS